MERDQSIVTSCNILLEGYNDASRPVSRACTRKDQDTVGVDRLIWYDAGNIEERRGLKQWLTSVVCGGAQYDLRGCHRTMEGDVSNRSSISEVWTETVG